MNRTLRLIPIAALLLAGCQHPAPAPPLAPTLAQRVRIRARATKLWERDGCPLGQSEAYLERARELDALEFDCPVQLPNPIASPPATYQGTLIEEASATRAGIGPRKWLS